MFGIWKREKVIFSSYNPLWIYRWIIQKKNSFYCISMVWSGLKIIIIFLAARETEQVPLNQLTKIKSILAKFDIKIFLTQCNPLAKSELASFNFDAWVWLISLKFTSLKWSSFELRLELHSENSYLAPLMHVLIDYWSLITTDNLNKQSKSQGDSCL